MNRVRAAVEWVRHPFGDFEWPMLTRLWSLVCITCALSLAFVTRLYAEAKGAEGQAVGEDGLLVVGSILVGVLGALVKAWERRQNRRYRPQGQGHTDGNGITLGELDRRIDRLEDDLKEQRRDTVREISEAVSAAEGRLGTQIRLSHDALLEAIQNPVDRKGDLAIAMVDKLVKRVTTLEEGRA